MDKYLSLIPKNSKGFDYARFEYLGYTRTSTKHQTGEKQKNEILSHFPLIKHFVMDKCRGDRSPGLRSFKNYQKVAFFADAPDRVIKSYEYRHYTELLDFLLSRRLCFCFPDLESLVSAAVAFWRNPRLGTLKTLLLSRMKRQFDTTLKSFSLTQEQMKEVSKCHQKLLDYKSLESEEMKFWLLYGHIGQAINQIIILKAKTGIQNRDKTFGNDFGQIRLFHALLDYEARYDSKLSFSPYRKPGLPCDSPYADFDTDDFEELSKDLSNNRQIRNRSNKRHCPYRLKARTNSEDYEIYREFVFCGIPSIFQWLPKKFKFDYPSVIPKGGPFSKSLREAMPALDFKELYEEQYRVLKAINAGKNVVYSTRTGGGKNSVPILYALSHPHELVVVASPLLALMSDYEQTLRKIFKKKNEIQILNSKAGSISDTLFSIKKEVRIFIATPEQLRKPEVIAALKKRGVDLFVMDECHHLLTSGAKEFRTAWKAEAFKKAFKALGYPTALLMSATIDARVMDEIRKFFNKIKKKYRLITGDLDRPNLELFTFYFKNRGQKLIALCKLLQVFRKADFKKGIIYFSTIKNLEKAEKILKQFKFKTLRYQGKTTEEFTQRQKEKSLELYRDSEDVIMLSTSAFGEGIDLKDVGFVIQFDIPESKMELAQWSGRAGRSGEKAPVVLMVDAHGITLRRHFIKTNENAEGKRVAEKMLDDLLDFLKANEHPTLSELNEEFVCG